ncbi:hypothetical protein [Roseovarius salis]|uniref:hypothetical protein n=1 Tax=Roseovarius salis TaxID=3376063 RepID=UPI0037CAB576
MKRYRAIYAKDAIGEVSRDVWEPETPSERNEALARTLYPNAKPKSWTVEDDIAEMRGLVDAGLIGMGWPPSSARLAVADDGSWREISDPKEVGEGEQHRWAFMWIDGAAPSLSEAYFLGKMAFCLVCMESNLAGGDMRGFMHNSMRLGMYQTEIDVRRIALRFADEGKKIAAGRKDAADAVNRQHRDLREARMREMERLTEKMSVNAAAKNLEARGFGGWQGIKKQWSRHRSKN